MDDRLIVALDTSDRDRALQLVERLRPVIRVFKIGLQLFTAHGPSVVRDVAAAGADVFLDLKLHDIPNTVAGAISSLRALPGVRLLTVHAGGGRSMLAAAARTARRTPGGPKIVGVTVLTSLDAGELAEVGVATSTEAQVRRLAMLARDSGLDGLVCSPLEVAALRDLLGPGAVLITPGVRPAGADAGDQKRVATPDAAIRAGATHLVVGRPVVQAPDPLDAARRIVESLP